MNKDEADKNLNKIETALAHLGRDPRRYSGFVNAPVFRGSTVLFPDAESLETRDLEFTYGRPSTPNRRWLSWKAETAPFSRRQA
jgi:cystathionine beta-lyase/cystathionine gamma-synthase